MVHFKKLLLILLLPTVVYCQHDTITVYRCNSLEQAKALEREMFYVFATVYHYDSISMKGKCCDVLVNTNWLGIKSYAIPLNLVYLTLTVENIKTIDTLRTTRDAKAFIRNRETGLLNDLINLALLEYAAWSRYKLVKEDVRREDWEIYKEDE